MRMSTITEIKDAVKNLPPKERHEIFVWMQTEETPKGDLSDETFCELGDALFIEMDREEQKV